MHWSLSYHRDPSACRIADRHYSRKSVGATQMMPPGRQLVLVAPGAVWGVSWPFAELVAHAWPGAMLCTIFRNETDILSSTLIREACAVTAWKWTIPDEGLITFIDRSKVRPKRNPGYCFLMSGFVEEGRTKAGLHVLKLHRGDFPPAEPPKLSQIPLL